ncbi:MAG: phosphoglucosamine mutase [Candidatus Aquicultorales bacterium]
MARLFGTDGVRGIANTELTPELAFKLGFAGALALGKGGFVIGRDTRISGTLLESALMAGLTSAGADVLSVGIMPTPAIAYLTKAMGATGGVVISASHNPAEYNGIKFFNGQGFKLSDELEDEIEATLPEVETAKRPTGGRIGRIEHRRDAEELYIEHVLSILGGSLSGLRVALDCANGAAYKVAPAILERAGAEVSALCSDPDGENINLECGSTHLERVRGRVLSDGFDLGLAHDGDADRVLAVDERGDEVDGDFIMAICGSHMKEKGSLPRDEVVVTVMTNLGFDLAMKQRGIGVVKTKVGDRYVLEEMMKRGAGLGGEQSGHIIFLEHATTGDGIITALKLCDVMRQTNSPLSELKGIMRRLPQVLINVKVPQGFSIDGKEPVARRISEVEENLGETGRVLVRPSGTEPLVRVMVEAPTDQVARSAAEEIVAAIESQLKG